MSLPNYGTLSISMINTELGRASNTANSSLQQLANLARTDSTPYANRANPKISDWYGYSSAIGFSHYLLRDIASGVSATCSDIDGNIHTVYASDNYMYVGQTLYDNSSLTIPFNGQGFKFLQYTSGDNLVEINSSGVILSMTTCPVGYAIPLAGIYIDTEIYEGFSSISEACTNGPGSTHYNVYSNDSVLSVGSRIYQDTHLNLYNSGYSVGYYHNGNTGTIFQFDSYGYVTSISTCTVPVSTLPCNLTVNYHNYVGGAAEPNGNEFYLYDNTTSTMIYQANSLYFDIDYNTNIDLIVGHSYTAHIRIHDFYSNNWCYSINDLIGNGNAVISGSSGGNNGYGDSYYDITFTVTSATSGDSINLYGYGYIDYY